MAEQVLTKQKLVNADEDVQALEDVINGEPGKLIKTRLGRQVYSLASVPFINTMTREEVNLVIDPKADKIYVDAALSSLSNGAAKFYPTLAEANADISNIGIKDKVEVGEVANGGVWYKATTTSTTLTKSAYDPVAVSTQKLDIALAPLQDSIKKNGENYLDEAVDKNFNVYRYTDDQGGLHIIGLGGSIQENIESLKQIGEIKVNPALATFEDAAGQVFAYVDSQSNLHLLNDIFIDKKSLKGSFAERDNQVRYQSILMHRFSAIKLLMPIAEKSEDNLIKRMPSAIQTPTGLVYFYHKQIPGYDGDGTGSELWKAIITIDEDLSVKVESRSLFLAPDAPRGIVKHPMLGRTSDNRIILIFEKRLETTDNYIRYQCYSSDEGDTFSTPTPLSYQGVNPAGISGNSALGTTGTITTAKNGRLIVPMYTTGGACYCIYSDDDGVNWTYSTWVNTAQLLGYEPSISLDMNEDLIMDVRPRTSYFRLKAKSTDNGMTWQPLTTQKIPSATNQGVIFRDKEIGAMIQVSNANQGYERTKFSLYISYDNANTFPFKYMPFSDTWYGGYSQILKWRDGIYIIVMEYAESFVELNTNENSGILILSLNEVLSNVSRN